MQLRALDIIERAKRKKIDIEIENVNKDINLKQLDIEQLKLKEQALKVQIDSDTRKRDDINLNIAHLQALRSHMTEEEYKLAADELSAESERIEGKISKDYTDLKNIRTDLATTIATISQRKDCLRQLAGPNAVKALHLPAAADSRPDEFFLNQCRTEIQTLFHSCQRIFKDMEGKDQKIIHLSGSLAAAKLRRLMDKPDVSSAEKIILHRAMGRLIALAKDTACGYIECIHKNFTEDWNIYIERVQKELWEFDRILEKRRQQSLISAVAEIVEAPEEEDGDSALITELMEGQILEKLKGLKVVICGSAQSRADHLTWIQDALQLKNLNLIQFSEMNDRKMHSLIESINAGGVDILVLVTKWMGHDFSTPVQKAAKLRGVKIVMTSGSSKRSIIRAMADAFETPAMAMAK